MNRSDQINELATALAKAQAAMPAIKKDKTADIPTKAGGRYSYNYADLATIMDVVRKPLTDNGLSLVQTVETGDKLVVVETMLAHESGQWISHQIGLSVDGDIRAIGSAITYGRRYGMCVTGVVTEDDDDGEQATTGHGAASAVKRTPPTDTGQKCPKCGGPMWDNRASKTNPKAPDYKCKDKSCGQGVWLDAKSAEPPSNDNNEPPPDESGWPELIGGGPEGAKAAEPWHTWKNASDAIQWGIAQGCFDHPNHAANAYDALKRSREWTKAPEMWAAWYADVTRRCAEKLAASVQAELVPEGAA